MKMMSVVLILCGLIVAASLILSRPRVRLALLLSPPARPLLMHVFQDETDTEMHEKYFFQLLRAHQYAEAHSLFTPQGQKMLPTATLQAQWMRFEQTHGRVTTWNKTSARVNLLPEYVDHGFLVKGSRGGTGKATLRLTQTNGDWRIVSATIKP